MYCITDPTLTLGQSCIDDRMDCNRIVPTRRATRACSPPNVWVNPSTSERSSDILSNVSRAWTSTVLARILPAATRFFDDQKFGTTTPNSLSHVGAATSSSRVRFAKVSRSAGACSAKNRGRRFCTEISNRKAVEGSYACLNALKTSVQRFFIPGCSEIFGKIPTLNYQTD